MLSLFTGAEILLPRLTSPSVLCVPSPTVSPPTKLIPAGRVFKNRPLTTDSLGITPSLRRTIVTLSPCVVLIPGTCIARLLILTRFPLGRQTLSTTPTMADPFVLPLLSKIRIPLGLMAIDMPLIIAEPLNTPDIFIRDNRATCSLSLLPG